MTTMPSPKAKSSPEMTRMTDGFSSAKHAIFVTAAGKPMSSPAKIARRNSFPAGAVAFAAPALA